MSHTVELSTPMIVGWTYAVQVNGDYLGIAFVSEDDELDNDVVVWNWKTGTRLLVSTRTERVRQLINTVFTSS